jgi:hypothetical protein
LRSAVRYWLEEYGFEVRTSETPDFPHALDREAREAAIASIDGCDYFLLIVGFRRGHLTDTAISITRAEFRYARDLKRATGRPLMLTFVRQEVQTLRRSALSEPPRSSDDWPAVLEFLTEVETADDPTDANWVQPFGNFRELTDALRATLNIRGPLPRMIAAANVAAELEWNGRLLLSFKATKGTRPITTYLRTAELPRPTAELGSYRLTKAVAAQFAWFWVLLPRFNDLRDFSLRDAIVDGHFLEHDTATGTFKAGEVQTSLLRLQELLGQCRSVTSKDMVESLRSDLNSIFAAARRDGPNQVVVDEVTLRWLWAVHGNLENLLKTSRAVYRYLAGATDVIQTIDETPVVPDAEMAQELKAERMTEALAAEWYLRSRWPEPESEPR